MPPVDPRGGLNVLEKLLEENPQAVVKFEDDDDVEAIEAMLQHIYGRDYAKVRQSRTPIWRFHLNVFIAGHKFDHTHMKKEALSKFTSLTKSNQNPNVSADILEVLPQYFELDPSLAAVEEKLRTSNFDQLVRSTAFCRAVERTPELLTRSFDDLLRILMERRYTDPKVRIEATISAMRAKTAACETCHGCVERQAFNFLHAPFGRDYPKEDNVVVRWTYYIPSLVKEVKKETDACVRCKDSVLWAMYSVYAPAPAADEVGREVKRQKTA